MRRRRRRAQGISEPPAAFIFLEPCKRPALDPFLRFAFGTEVAELRLFPLGERNPHTPSLPDRQFDRFKFHFSSDIGHGLNRRGSPNLGWASPDAFLLKRCRSGANALACRLSPPPQRKAPTVASCDETGRGFDFLERRPDEALALRVVPTNSLLFPLRREADAGRAYDASLMHRSLQIVCPGATRGPSLRRLHREGSRCHAGLRRGGTPSRS